ncbi:MAG: ABC transporter ATP-binding protein [Candidatus Kryptoniota bacterium]
MIQLQNVSKRFGETLAIDNISMNVEPGTSCGYIGPNGAGKTTTVRLLTGMLLPDEGNLSISGLAFNKNKKELLSIIGYVPESPVLYEPLTPMELFDLSASLRSVPFRSLSQQIEIMSRIFSFSEYLTMPIYDLSKGTKQKVVLTLALLFKPKLLVLDEPTDGLDAKSVIVLKSLLKRFVQIGGTVFYSSHLLDVVETICDKVYFIDKGKIKNEYLMAELSRERETLENKFLENININEDLQLIDELFDYKI